LRQAREQGVPEIDLTILDQPGRERLTQALEQGRFDVFHYAGHSNLGQAGGNLYLVNNRTGLTEELSGDDLAGLLVNNGIRLAVFNSCRGSYAPTADLNKAAESGNLAEAVIKRGIPAVLAMAERIPDEVALTLTRLFYRNLRKMYPIDLSLNRSRQGLIAAYTSNQSSYWALPILYLHPEFDGYLTPSDRTFGNPADRLVSAPQGFGSIPVLAINENSPLPTHFLIDDSQPPTDEEMVVSAVLAEDDPGDWIEDLEAFDDDDDETETLDWIRQLTSQASDETASHLTDSDSTGSSSSVFTPAFTPAEEISLEKTDETIAEEITEPALTDSWITSFSADAAKAANPSSTANTSFSSNTSNTTAAFQLDYANPPQSDFSSDITLAKAIVISTPMGEGSSTSMAQALPLNEPIQPRLPQSDSDHRSHPTVHLNTDQTSSRQGILIPMLGAVGAAAIAVLSYVIVHPIQLTNPTPNPAQTIPTAVPSFSQKLANSTTEEAKTVAINSFEKQQLAQGQQAVEVLLNRNALPEAAAALATVSKLNQGDPDIQFLQGRLAWQAIKQGDAQYQLADVRKAWENAAEKQPNSALYQQMLGFVYYAEGNPSQAIESWMRARSILENSQLPKVSSLPTPADQSIADLNTSYAGVALAIRQISAQEAPDRQDRISDKANKLYRMVLNSSPENFSPTALEKNWMWNETAIQDWQKLTQAES
ncbi:MAG: CHAT domain-containing protein, partial [Leptolyngbyaceae cyanobacterium CRU_2_3]|nr:CHAT domain-containing protein [Leptolyngbyaceae cyanobacterium CRU_2_3]